MVDDIVFYSSYHCAGLNGQVCKFCSHRLDIDREAYASSCEVCGKMVNSAIPIGSRAESMDLLELTSFTQFPLSDPILTIITIDAAGRSVPSRDIGVIIGSPSTAHNVDRLPSPVEFVIQRSVRH